MAEGTIIAFDDHRGLGEIEATAPAEIAGTHYPFHCTRIADGTRTIALDTPVTFDIAPGPLGRWEATAIEKG